MKDFRKWLFKSHSFISLNFFFSNSFLLVKVFEYKFFFCCRFSDWFVYESRFSIRSFIETWFVSISGNLFFFLDVNRNPNSLQMITIYYISSAGLFRILFADFFQSKQIIMESFFSQISSISRFVLKWFRILFANNISTFPFQVRFPFLLSVVLLVR